MKIYIVSQSGFLNLGDELILKTWVEQIKTRTPKASIIIDSASPGLTSYLLGHDNDIIITDFFWKTSRLMDETGDYSINHLRNEHSFIELFEEALDGVSHLILLGGGHINSNYKPNLLLTHIAAEWKSTFNYKLLGFGLGLMPIDRQLHDPIYRHFAWSMTQFDWIDVRDTDSLDFIQSLHINHASVSCDDVFIAPLDRYFSRSNNKNHHGRLILAVHGNCGRDAEIIDFCIRLAKFHPNARNEIAFLLFGDEDIRTATRISRSIGPTYNISIHHFNKIYTNGFETHESDYAFTTKFHGHLLLSLAGVKGMFCSIDHPYYDIKQQSLLALGSGYKAVGLHDHIFNASDLVFDNWNGGLRAAHPHLYGLKHQILDHFLPITLAANDASHPRLDVNLKTTI